MRFLIARLSSLGDVACTLPVAGALKLAYPESEVQWAVDPRFRAVVEACRWVDKTIEARPGLNPATWIRPEGEFDVAFDLQGLFKSAILIARSRSKLKLGYHWQREGASLFSRPVRPDPTSFHIVDQYVDVARAAIQGLGGPLRDLERADFGMAPKPEAVASVQAKRLEKGLASPYVVLNAGAGWATKRWPAVSFASVSDRLHESGFQTVLIGGKSPLDLAAAQEVIRSADRPPVDLVGQTSVDELIALLSQAAAHIGGDTGSTHLSAALGIPAIGLYSITRPQRSCPYGQVERCLYDEQALANLRPEDVFAKVSEALPSPC